MCVIWYIYCISLVWALFLKGAQVGLVLRGSSADSWRRAKKKVPRPLRPNGRIPLTFIVGLVPRPRRTRARLTAHSAREAKTTDVDSASRVVYSRRGCPRRYDARHPRSLKLIQRRRVNKSYFFPARQSEHDYCAVNDESNRARPSPPPPRAARTAVAVVEGATGILAVGQREPPPASKGRV